jgi:hypothetical protein
LAQESWCCFVTNWLALRLAAGSLNARRLKPGISATVMPNYPAMTTVGVETGIPAFDGRRRTRFD